MNTGATYRHVLKYTGVFGLVQGITLLSSAGRNKLTTLLLGPMGLGLISVYNTISEFAVNCSNFGLPVYITHDASALNAEADADKMVRFACVARTCAFWTALFGVVFTMFLSPFLSYHFFEKESGRYQEVIALIPIVVSMIIAEAECSLLKGLRRLRRVAVLETICAVTTLLFTIPFYFFMGFRGVIFGLTVSTLVSCLLHLSFSASIIPYRIRPFDLSLIREGWPMVKKGVPYAMTSIANAGTTLLLASIIVAYDTLEGQGYYRAGYTLMVSYAALIFKALDSEYYPRLSAINTDNEKVRLVVNQQTDVCVNLVAPFLILFVLSMPVIIPLFFRSDFLVLLNMTISSAYYMFFRAIMLPVSYTPLAKGDSVLFLVMDLLSDVAILFSMLYFYPRYQLFGAGIALSVASFVNMSINLIICKLRYGFIFSKKTLLCCVCQFIFLTISLAICFFFPSSPYLLIVLVTLLCSSCYSYNKLRKKGGV